MIMDIKEIKRLADARFDDNLRFKSVIKEKTLQEVDALFHKTFEEVETKIDCTQCGNCCAELQPPIGYHEISRIAAAAKMTPDDFKAEYLRPLEGKLHYLHAQPCPFLSHHKCTIYDDRPESCHHYPHLHHEEMIFSLYSVINNYAICPIVFNTVEQIKQETGFK